MFSNSDLSSGESPLTMRAKAGENRYVPAPVAVPGILLGVCLRRLPTSATRSGRLFCHRQRSHRSPLGIVTPTKNVGLQRCIDTGRNEMRNNLGSFCAKVSAGTACSINRNLKERQLIVNFLIWTWKAMRFLLYYRKTKGGHPNERHE